MGKSEEQKSGKIDMLTLIDVLYLYDELRDQLELLRNFDTEARTKKKLKQWENNLAIAPLLIPGNVITRPMLNEAIQTPILKHGRYGEKMLNDYIETLLENGHIEAGFRRKEKGKRKIGSPPVPFTVQPKNKNELFNKRHIIAALWKHGILRDILIESYLGWAKFIQSQNMRSYIIEIMKAQRRLETSSKVHPSHETNSLRDGWLDLLSEKDTRPELAHKISQKAIDKMCEEYELLTDLYFEPKKRVGEFNYFLAIIIFYEIVGDDTLSDFCKDVEQYGLELADALTPLYEEVLTNEN